MFKGWNIKGKTLTKSPINEKKHLLWRMGGVPTVPVNIWVMVKDKVDGIRVPTQQGRAFSTSKEAFELNKTRIHTPPFEPQYAMEKEYWIIQ